MATMSGTPPETDQQLKWELVYAPGDLAAFTIDPTTGVVRTTNASFDYETSLGPVYASVRATDNGTGALSSAARLVVRIIDSNEPPVCPSPISYIVLEDTNAYSYAGPRAAAVDLDSFDSPNVGKLNFSLSGGGPFAVDHTGQLFLAGPSRLDFEQQSRYNISLRTWRQ